MLYALQTEVEETYSKKTSRNRVMKDLIDSKLSHIIEPAVDKIVAYKIGKYWESKEARIDELEETGIPEYELVYECLAAICITEVPQPIQAVVTRIARNLEMKDELDSVKTAAELLATVHDESIFDFVRNVGGDEIMVQSYIVLADETIDALDSLMYLPPMVAKPNEVKGNIDTSHMTVKSSLLLGALNHHEGNIVTDHIERCNSVPLCLDTEMLKYEEKPKDPLETKEQIQQFHKMSYDSRQVYNFLLEEGNKFYLTHKYDYRGRTYSQGYHVNIQSTDYKKAIISLANKEVIPV